MIFIEDYFSFCKDDKREIWSRLIPILPIFTIKKRTQVSWKFDSTIVGAAKLRTFLMTQSASKEPEEPNCETPPDFVHYSLRNWLSKKWQ